LTQEEEYNGADLSIHKIKANPELWSRSKHPKVQRF
jgi:hypothetical protein